jgi:hypothetical protein
MATDRPFALDPVGRWTPSYFDLQRDAERRPGSEENARRAAVRLAALSRREANDATPSRVICGAHLPC